MQQPAFADSSFPGNHHGTAVGGLPERFNKFQEGVFLRLAADVWAGVEWILGFFALVQRVNFLIFFETFERKLINEFHIEVPFDSLSNRFIDPDFTPGGSGHEAGSKIYALPIAGIFFP